MQVHGSNSSLESPQLPIHQDRQKWRSDQGSYAGDGWKVPGKLLPLNTVLEQLVLQSPPDDHCQAVDRGDLPWDAHQGNIVKVSDQPLEVDEEL